MPWTQADADLLRVSVEQQFTDWQRRVFYGLGRKSGKPISARNFMAQSRYGDRLTERLFRELFPEGERKVSMSQQLPDDSYELTVRTKASGMVVTIRNLLIMQDNQREELSDVWKSRDTLRRHNSDLEDRLNKLRRHNHDLRGDLQRTLNERNDAIGKMEIGKATEGYRDNTLVKCNERQADLNDELAKENRRLSEVIKGLEGKKQGSDYSEGVVDNSLAACSERQSKTINELKRHNASLRTQIDLMGEVAVSQSQLIVHPEHINTADVEIKLRGQAILTLCHRAHDRKQKIHGLTQAVAGYRKKLKESEIRVASLTTQAEPKFTLLSGTQLK